MQYLWEGEMSVYNPECPPEQTVKIDLMLYNRMRPSQDCCCFEKKARRDGYEKPGGDGVFLVPGEWEGLPEISAPGFNIDEAQAKVAK